MKIIKRDTLSIREVNLFKAVYKWAEKQCCEASVEPSDTNLRTAADKFKYIRFPTMNFTEFADCSRYGLNILTSEEKEKEKDIWDSNSKVKESVHINSTKRIQPAGLFKAFRLRSVSAPYNANVKYTFEFIVRRIVYLTSITVIRNCRVIIPEKERGEMNFIKKQLFVNLENRKFNQERCLRPEGSEGRNLLKVRSDLINQFPTFIENIQTLGIKNDILNLIVLELDVTVCRQPKNIFSDNW